MCTFYARKISFAYIPFGACRKRMAPLTLCILTLIGLVSTIEALVTSSDEPLLTVDHTGPSSKGTDFYIAFLGNADGMTILQSKPLYQIIISTDEPGPVTVTVSLNHNLPADMREVFPLTTSVSYGNVVTVTFHENIAVEMNNEDLNQYKAIHVRTENGKKVTIQGFNDNVQTSDGFIALPCDAMRNNVFTHYEYFVLAADQKQSKDDPPKKSFVLIIPCHDDTDITVEPSQLITFSGLGRYLPSGHHQMGQGAHTSTTTITANAGQTLLITHPNDLSGSIVQSSNPIVLLSGHECGEVPHNTTECGYMIEQMPPGITLGKTFLLVPLAGRDTGDLFRVGTLTDNVHVRVTCVTPSNNLPVNLPLERGGIINRGGYITFMTPGNTDDQLNWRPSYCCLDATEPVIVAQYSTGYSDSNSRVIGDPFMIIVPPQTQYLNNYTMTSLTGVSGPFPTQYISLSIAAQFFNNSMTDREKIKLNEKTVIPIDGWVPMYCSDMVVCGYGAQVEVPRGRTQVYHEDKNVGLGVLYYAYQQYRSYAMPQGYELTPISEVTVSISAQSYEVIESVGLVDIVVMTNGVFPAIIEGTLTTLENGSASGISDFTSGSYPFIIPVDRIQTTASISITDDDMIELPRETFSVSLSIQPQPRLTVGISEATITIIDDDHINMHFNHTSYTVVEGDSVHMVLQKQGSTEVSAIAIISTEEGTACALDFQRVQEQIVIFGPNETEKTFTITTVQDNLIETTEQFSVVVSSTFDIGTTTEETVNITIVDNGYLEIGFLPEIYMVNEAEGAVTLSVVKRSQTSVPVAVQIFTVDGSATASNDYNNVTLLVVFEPHEVVKEIQVVIVQDSVSEGEEVFTVNLVAVQDEAEIDITIDEDDGGVATIIIEDDDIAEVQFVKTAYTVSEGDGEIEVCLMMVGQVAADVVVRLTAISDTAMAGLDYIQGILNFVNFQPPGESVVCTAFEIIDDFVALEGDELFVVEVSVIVGEITIGVNSRTTVVIQDNDVLMMKVANTAISVSENECTIEICLVKNMDTAEILTVNLILTEVSSNVDADLRTINATITFLPLDREACTLVKISDGNIPDGFMVDVSVDDVDLEVPPVLVTITSDDTDGVGICDIRNTLTIRPFGRNDSYQFEGSCDHYLLQLCDGLNDVSVIVDFISDALDSARVGLRYGNSSVVSTETGNLVIKNLLLIETVGNSEIYTNGITILRESGINLIVLLQTTGNITIIHKYEDDDRFIQVRVTENLSFGGHDTDVPSPVSVCGLCGNIDGTLLHSDLLTVANITNQEHIALFTESYSVEASEQFLRGQRRECSVVTNDTVTGDPVFTVPIWSGGALCYDVRGQPGIFLNLISDKCTSVNAEYQAMNIAENGNIIRSIGIKAVGPGGNCYNITVQDSDPITTLINNFEISGIFESEGIRIRIYSERVRVSVPNCELIDLVMWITREVTNGQTMLRFQISRGYNLAPTSHGLLGQFWNIPVSIEQYFGPIKGGYAGMNVTYHLITVTQATSTRTFLGELFDIPWDRRSGSCYYAGDADGGRSGSSDDYDSVIEGKYTEYQVVGLFGHKFKYTQFRQDLCTTDI